MYAACFLELCSLVALIDTTRAFGGGAAAAALPAARTPQ